jgi:hypothetical protein
VIWVGAHQLSPSLIGLGSVWLPTPMISGIGPSEGHEPRVLDEVA